MKKLIISLLLLFLISIPNLYAEVIDIEYHDLKRLVNGINSLGWTQDELIVFNSWVDKTYTTDGTDFFETEMFAIHDWGLQSQLVRGMSYRGVDITDNLYNRYAGGILYDENLTDPWEIFARNGEDETHVTTHDITGVGAIPFVRNVTLQGGGLTPTVRWDAGNDPYKDVILILHDSIGREMAMSGKIPASTGEYIIPEGLLNAGEQYTARVYVGLRTDTSGSVHVSASNTFIDFTPLAEGNDQEVYLPSIGIDTNPDDDLGAAAYFDIDVTADSPVFIDPFVATGYEYKIGLGNPLFQSVILPILGDNQYDLYLWSGDAWLLEEENLAGGVEFIFGDGTDYFKVLGIEESLGIDPEDVTAFITELKFMEDGVFTGTMTPIQTWVDPAPVPIPSTILLLGFGIIGLAGVSRRTK